MKTEQHSSKTPIIGQRFTTYFPLLNTPKHTVASSTTQTPFGYPLGSFLPQKLGIGYSNRSSFQRFDAPSRPSGNSLNLFTSSRYPERPQVPSMAPGPSAFVKQELPLGANLDHIRRKLRSYS